MTFEVSHGKARPTLPRVRALAVAPPASEANQGRDARGRFTGTDSPAFGRGWKTLIAKMAGRELVGEAAELGKASWRLYLALLGELPHDGPTVRSLAAAQARSAILSARYASRATEVGLDTEAGQKAIDLSVKLDQRAERLAVTASELAGRLARQERKGGNPLHAAILSAPTPPVVDAPPTDGGQP